MKTMRYFITNLLAKFTKTAANDDLFVSDEAIAARQERLRQRQKAMYDKMMADGTHVHCGRAYKVGDSDVLRSAGFVK